MPAAPAALASGEELDQLIGAHVQELIQVDALQAEAQRCVRAAMLHCRRMAIRRAAIPSLCCSVVPGRLRGRHNGVGMSPSSLRSKLAAFAARITHPVGIFAEGALGLHLVGHGAREPAQSTGGCAAGDWAVGKRDI